MPASGVDLLTGTDVEGMLELAGGGVAVIRTRTAPKEVVADRSVSPRRSRRNSPHEETYTTS